MSDMHNIIRNCNKSLVEKILYVIYHKDKPSVLQSTATESALWSEWRRGDEINTLVEHKFQFAKKIKTPRILNLFPAQQGWT